MRRFLALLRNDRCCTPALADPPAEQPDATVPPVVVTATRVPTPAIDIPAGVTVIDRQDHRDRDYNTLVDALQAVPGLRVASPAGRAARPACSSAAPTPTLCWCCVTACRSTTPRDSDGAFNFGVDTLADVERIEIIRGPMAALYGSGAIGGVINLITRRGTEDQVRTGKATSRAAIRRRSAAAPWRPASRGRWIMRWSWNRSRSAATTRTPQRESIYTGVPQGYRDRHRHAEPGLHGGAGHAGVAAAACARVAVRFQRTRGSHLRRLQRQRHDDSLLGRIGVTSTLFGGTYQTSLLLGREQEDRRYYEPLNPADVNNMAMVDDRYHSYRTDLQWNNTVHLNDFFSSAVLSATDLTFGYRAYRRTRRISG